MFCFMAHLFACLWIIFFMDDFDPDGWMTNEVKNLSPIELYLMSVYFVITTMTTVGYGDISAGTVTEQLFCIILMILGVVIFTFLSGALASMIGTMDEDDCDSKEKVRYLEQIQYKYNLP
jgi:hypothetical protein